MTSYIFFFSCEKATGELFAWGSGRGGKLGFGNIQDRYMPLKVGPLQDREVVSVACDELHSAVVTGEIFIQYPLKGFCICYMKRGQTFYALC